MKIAVAEDQPSPGEGTEREGHNSRSLKKFLLYLSVLSS
jgi:hypothetical protein